MVMDSSLRATIESFDEEKIERKRGIDEANITINESIGRAAFYYEKLRNILDYQDERLFLKNAIKRILLRRAFFKTKDSATRLLRELVWAKYFENDQIPLSEAEEIASILRKYDFIRQNIKSRRNYNELNRTVLGLAACEIETHLAEPISRKKFLVFAKDIVSKNIQISSDELSGINLEQNIELILKKNLFKSDLDILRFELLGHYNEFWPDINMEEAQALCNNFDSVVGAIDRQIEQSKNAVLTKYIKRYIPTFSIIWELVNTNRRAGKAIFTDKDKFNEIAKAIIERKNKNIRKKVLRAIFRGIIFILFTKIVLAFMIEVPYEINIGGQINYLALSINTLAPPLIMLISGLFIKMPGKKNTSVLLKIIDSAVFEGEIPLSKLNSLQKKKRRGHVIFNTFYFLISLAILAGVVWGLLNLEFGPVSIALFLFFVSIVSSLAFKIRATAREFEVKSTEDSIFSGVIGLILLPFIVIGKFLSEKWSEYNFTLLFWDFIIEAPFKTIIGFLEGWFYFLREKREDFE